MVRGIHYFSAEVKPKLMSSQGAALSFSEDRRLSVTQKMAEGLNKYNIIEKNNYVRSE